MTLESGHTFTQWSLLSDKEKKINRELTWYAFDYCIKNPNVLLSYKEMNNAGLEHIYSFFIKYSNCSDSSECSECSKCSHEQQGKQWAI